MAVIKDPTLILSLVLGSLACATYMQMHDNIMIVVIPENPLAHGCREDSKNPS